ncbi:MAG TPA: hypothetical protein VG675_19350 [Bryobacteraceae bacterium]|nr:hypothetical protein [Bryobacteraceae bacterium]
MTDVRRHVLLWIAPEFLRSTGMVQLFTEAGIFLPPEDDMDEYMRSAEAAGGFAMTGKLAEANHGAGIWISPADIPGLELMVPWPFVRSVVTAESPQPSRAFGLMQDFVQSNGARQKSAREDKKQE